MTEYESLAGFCKYMSNSEAVLDGVFSKRTIRFTQPSALNDPFDCNPILKVPSSADEHSMYSVAGVGMPSENLWYHVQLIQSHINHYGVLSLTKNPVSADMWSAYANGHRGFLLEFAHDFQTHHSFLSKDGSVYPVRQVDYVDRFLIDLETCLDSSRSIMIEKFRELLFYQKAKRWAKEKEFRMVRSLVDIGKEPGGIHIGIKPDNKPYVSDLPFSTINSITFGAKMARETKLWIVDKCKDTKVQFLQCLVYPSKLDDEGLSPVIQLVPLDNPEVLKKIVALDPQLLLMASDDLLGHKDIAVSKVSELPYYQGFETLVDMMYERRKRKHG